MGKHSSFDRWCRWVRELALVSVVFGVWFPAEAWAEWKVRPRHRWQQIAQRLQRDYLASPRPGYTLQRLLQHYRKKGGYRTLLLTLPTLASQQKPKPIPQARLSLALGILAMQARDTTRAIAFLQTLVSPPLRLWLGLGISKPKVPDPAAVRSLPVPQKEWLLYWAQIHFQGQIWPQARRAYRLLLYTNTAVKQQHTWRQKLLWIDEKDGRWDAVQQHYRFLIKHRPKRAEYRERLAQVLLRLNQPLEAEGQLRVAERLVSPSKRPELWLQRVQILERLRRFPQALQLLQQIRRTLVPHHWMQRTCIDLEMRLYRQQKNLPALLAIYRQRSISQPRLYLPILPSLLQELGQKNQALQAYRLLLKKYPNPAVLQDVVVFLQKLQRYAEAVQLLRTQLTQTPKDSRWALLLLQTHHLAKQYELRDLAIRQFLECYEQELFFLHSLQRGMARWSLSPALQLAIYQKLCPLPPQSAHCYEQWGALLWQQNQKSYAFAVWEKILAIHPVIAQNQWILAQIYHRHGYFWQSQALLEKLVRLQPPLRQAQHLLSEIYLRQGQPQQALRLLALALARTSQIEKRRKIREDMLRALSLQYHSSLLWDILRRNHWLQPFSVEPHKQMLLYFVRYPHRFVSPRYRRYLAYRYTRRLSRGAMGWRRGRLLHHHSSHTTRIPPEVPSILSDGLLIAPQDPELYDLAVQVYRNHPKSLDYLRKLLEIDSTRLAQNLRLYQQQARRWNREQDIVPRLQHLTKKYPYHAVVWGDLAHQALRQKNWVLAQQSYQKARQLDKKPFAYTCGLAKVYAEQKQWRESWRILRDYRERMTLAQQETRLLYLIRYGLTLGYSAVSLLQQLKQVSPAKEGALFLAYTLWKHRNTGLSEQERHFFVHAIRETRKDWSQDIEQQASAIRRFRAYLLLHSLDKKAFLAKMPTLFQDTHPPIRMMGALAIALYQQQSQFARLDRLERADPHAGVRHAAHFAVSVLLRRWRYSSLDHTLPAELWHGFLLPLVPVSGYPEYRMLLHIARQYRVSPAYLQRHIFLKLHQIPVTAVNILNQMLESSQYRCFAFAAINHLRGSTSPKPLQQAALELNIPKPFFYAHCQQQHLTAPQDLFDPAQCLSVRRVRSYP